MLVKIAPYALLVFRGILLSISVAYSNSEVRGTLFYLGHSEKTFGTEVQFLCYGLRETLLSLRKVEAIWIKRFNYISFVKVFVNG